MFTSAIVFNEQIMDALALLYAATISPYNNVLPLMFKSDVILFRDQNGTSRSIDAWSQPAAVYSTFNCRDGAEFPECIRIDLWHGSFPSRGRGTHSHS